LVAALILWGGVTAAAIFDWPKPTGLQQVAWYAVSVLLLTPAISVLGARRPLTRVWTWFVVLPYCLVFSWPAAASLKQLLRGGEFHLESPMAVGYGFVVVMGVGNYLGTRYTMPTTLILSTLLLLIAAAADVHFSWMPTPEQCRSIAPFAVCAAIWWAARMSRETYPVRTPLDRVWIEFRDSFGIVWSKRILDRLNGMAAHDHLSARMDMSGIVPVNPTDVSDEYHPDPIALTGLEKHLRWLFRRFVDDDWIDERLNLVEPSPESDN